MKFTLKFVAWALMVSGLIWFSQGIGLLPGSFMTGQIKWSIYGVLALICGLVLLRLIRRSEIEK
ncbi:MAG: hypothetical protein WBI20_01535 [Burkholderiaceae bacterium]